MDITQETLSQLAGSSLRSIKNLEKGTGNPTWGQMEKTFQVLGWELILRNRSNEEPESENPK